MKRAIARFILRLVGWQMVGELPGPKAVVIGVPHTSNWDMPLAILAIWALELDGKWVAKHTIFRGPAGWLFRWMGGVPLDRERTRNFVSGVVEEFERRERFVFLIAPEGTRSRKDAWRSGFYWIAYEAGVPIVLGFLDYGRKVGGLGPALTPTGDVETDLEELRKFYANIEGRHPEQFSPIRLRARPEA